MIKAAEEFTNALELAKRHRQGLQRFLGHLLPRLVQRVIQRGVGLVSFLFLVRHLSKDELGIYQFALVAVSFVAFTAMPGLDNAVMQSVSRGSKRPYLRATRISFLASVAGSLMLVGTSVWSVWHQEALCAPLLVAAALFPFYQGIVQWKSVLLGELRIRDWSTVEIVTAVVTHSMIIAAVLLNVKNLAVFTGIYLAPTAGINLLATLRTYGRLKSSPEDAGEPELIRYGLHTSYAMVASLVAEQVERVVIFLFISPLALAVYYAGDRLSELIRSIVQDISAILAPSFARMSWYYSEVRNGIWLTCAVAGVLIILFAFTLAPPVLILIFGRQYASSVPYAQALLCSVALGNVGQFQFRFIRSQLDSSAFRGITLWTSVMRIVACLIFVPLWGAWGAVVSVFLQRFVISVASSAVIRKQYGPPTETAFGDGNVGVTKEEGERK